jgi:hypothetical protein
VQGNREVPNDLNRGEALVAFDSRIIEAKFALGAIHPEDLPGVAIEALEAGIDGPVTRRTAGLVGLTGYEADRVRDLFMAEAGLEKIERRVAAARLAQDLAREVLRGGKDPLQFTRGFERLWIAADYPSELGFLGNMDDEVYLYGTNLDGAREMVRERLVEIAEALNLP